LNDFGEMLLGLVADSTVYNESFGAVIEPVHYGDFDADDWTAFFLKSGSLPAWPQVLIAKVDRLKTIRGVPTEYVETTDGPWRVLRYPSLLSYPLRAADAIGD
jgi:hypothetical protein